MVMMPLSSVLRCLDGRFCCRIEEKVLLGVLKKAFSCNSRRFR
ncbi:unnamed protein product [Arabidopsis halleri]